MPKLGGTRMTAAIRILLFSVVGTLSPAVANTITFNEPPLFTSINGQTIKGVLFSFVANYSNSQAIIFGESKRTFQRDGTLFAAARRSFGAWKRACGNSDFELPKWTRQLVELSVRGSWPRLSVRLECWFS